MPSPTFLMTDPAHFDVAYAINPWMAPETWARDRARWQAAARASWEALRRALVEEAGATVHVVPAEPGLPDLVFPANAAVVLDGRALLGRFRHPERRPEEGTFLAALARLRDAGVLRDVAQLPAGVFQEGAGDCVWDAARGRFWAGVGPRSSAEAAERIGEHFGAEVTPLRLVSDRFYHMDVALCALSGGELLHYPPAFAPEALATLRAAVPAELLLEASDADAAALAVNAVCVERTVIMATPPAALRATLEARGYRVVAVDLDPFLLSGGAAFCMTLRLDLQRAPLPSLGTAADRARADRTLADRTLADRALADRALADRALATL